MKKAVRLISGTFMAGAVLALASAASATTWSADFSGPGLDPSLGYFTTPGFTYSVGGGSLTTNYSTAPSTTPTIADGGVYTNFTVDGSYIDQFTVNASGEAPSIYPNSFFSGGGLFHQASAFGGAGVYNDTYRTFTTGSVTINGVYIAGPSNVITYSNATFRFERYGDSVVEYVAPAGTDNFTLLDSASGGVFLGPTGFTLDTYYDGTPGVASASITYSNFSVTYGSDPSLPQSISDLVGGDISHPVALPTGTIGSINGGITGIGAEDFYSFYWRGGQFISNDSVVGATPPTAYTVDLLDSRGDVIQTISIDGSDNFVNEIDQNLLAGTYSIGVISNTAVDPQFYLDFITPVLGGVPEPKTWGLLLVGFASLGVSLRSRRKSSRAIQ